MGGITVVTIKHRSRGTYVIACPLNKRDHGQSCIPEIQRAMRLKGWQSAFAVLDDYEFRDRQNDSPEWRHRVPYRLQPQRLPLKVTL